MKILLIKNYFSVVVNLEAAAAAAGVERDAVGFEPGRKDFGGVGGKGQGARSAGGRMDGEGGGLHPGWGRKGG